MANPEYDITIRICSPRGRGATVTAKRIVQVLRTFGMECTYQGPTGALTETTNHDIDDPFPIDGLERRRILVIDQGKWGQPS